MSRIFFGNFDFERELDQAGDISFAACSDSLPKRRSNTLSRQSRPDLACAWLGIADSDDVILTDGAIDAADFRELAELGLPIPKFAHNPSFECRGHPAQFVPWGWSQPALALGQARGWRCDAPPLDVVHRVNSRAFRFEIERNWGIALPGEALAASFDELCAILEQRGSAARGWLLKACFGMSGRESLRGRGTILDEKTGNWAKRRLLHNQPIVVEPFVERVAEAGIQFEIPATGPVELVGVTPLLVDGTGVYRGSRFACPASELEVWQPAVEAGFRVAKFLQRLGYFGPLGIDAMRYRDEMGEIQLRPLQDINARYTMGRLALGFCRIAPPGWCGTWVHIAARRLDGREFRSWLGGLAQTVPAETKCVVTSPRAIGSILVDHHTALLLAPSIEALKQAELALFGSLGISVGV